MKSAILLLLSVIIFTGKAEYCFAVVKYADKKIEKDIHYISTRHPLIEKQLDKLSSSALTYVIRYGNDEEPYDALFETDGRNLFLTFRQKKGYSYSLAVCFAHEATHGIQFERGQIGFCQNKDGDWSAVNIDLWDEAEAFKMSLAVADDGDLCLGGLGTFKIKYETEGYDKAVLWLNSFYPTLSVERKNNPDITKIEVAYKLFTKYGCMLFCEAYQLSDIQLGSNEKD